MKANFKQYTFSNQIYMFFCLIRTKLFYPQAKIIRFPFDIRNSKNIKIGKGFTTGRMCRLEVAPDAAKGNKICMEIGENVRLNELVHIAALECVKIGNNSAIGAKSFISDLNHGNFAEGEIFDINQPHAQREIFAKPVIIGNNVWIGESVCILPGVNIGDGCIIGALSNVTKSIPSYSIAVGNPARVVKKYNFDTKCWERVSKL